jgi:ribonuclease PH
MEWRSDGRANNQLRPISIELGFIDSPLGSVFYKQGKTWVLAAMDVIEGVPQHCKGTEQGWLSAEYSLLPTSTRPRSPREARLGRQAGRTVEIQRIIGRALRSVVDLFAVGENTILIDCDILQADGGTRTASITASCLAMAQGCHRLMVEEGWARNPIRDFLVGVSVGSVQGELLLDLNYNEDHMAQVDMNLGITSKGSFVEIQGTGEGRPFTQDELSSLLNLAQKGARDTIEICKVALEKANIGFLE